MKSEQPLSSEITASLFEKAQEEAEKLLTLFPLIRRALEVFDRNKLQKAWEQNELINRNLEDKTEQLLELCRENSSVKEIEGIRPVLDHFHNLKMISKNFSRFMEEIKIRIAEGIIFSDRAFQQLNYLWQTIDDILSQIAAYYHSPKKAEPGKIIAQCTQLSRLIDQYDIEHEERLIRGVCPIKASSIFLDMLDSLRSIVRCLRNISATF